MGLAISRAIVEVHHGTISVSSAHGEGSTFTVWFQSGAKKARPADISDIYGHVPMVRNSNDALRFARTLQCRQSLILTCSRFMAEPVSEKPRSLTPIHRGVILVYVTAARVFSQLERFRRLASSIPGPQRALSDRHAWRVCFPSISLGASVSSR